MGSTARMGSTQRTGSTARTGSTPRTGSMARMSSTQRTGGTQRTGSTPRMGSTPRTGGTPRTGSMARRPGAWAWGAVAAILLLSGCGRSITIDRDVGPVSDGGPGVDADTEDLVGLRLDPSAVTLDAGSSVQLRALGELADGSAIEVTDLAVWSSDDPSIASVDAGLVTAAGPGSATVQAEVGALRASASVEVREGAAVELERIEVAPALATLVPGGTLSFVATAVYSDGSTEDITDLAEWSTEDPAVATVSAGLVEGVAPGVTVVRAAFAERTASAQVEVLDATIVGLSVLPPVATTGVGGIARFTAEAELSDGRRLDVTESATWSADPVSVASIVGPGEVEGVAGGEATVAASFDGREATATLGVTAADLSRIEVTPLDPTVGVGVDLAFQATGIFEDGTRADLTPTVLWVATNPAVLAVDEDGRGRTQSPGTSIVRARLGDVEGTSTVTVTAATLLGIVVDPASVTLGPGERTALSATGTYSDGSQADVSASVLWTSDDAAVVTVSNAPGREGELTGLSAGTTTVRASIGDVEGSASVRVTDAGLVGLEVDPTDVVLPVGGSADLSATGTFSDGSSRDVTAEVVWTSDAASVARVASAGPTAGRVTALAEGVATVTASLAGVSATATVEVTAAALSSIRIEPEAATTTAGLRTFYRAVGTFGDGSVAELTTLVLWGTADADVAEISNLAGAEGQLLAVGAGTTDVTASFDGVEGRTTVTVEGPRLTEVQVTPVAPDVPVGQSLQLTATAIFSDGSRQNVTGRASWASSATAVATVNGFGGVTTLAAGTSTITATFQGVSGTATLEVRDATVVEVQVTPIAPTLTVGTQVRFQAVAILSDGTSANVTGQATYTSSAPAVLGISNAGPGRGVGTALAAGTATVSATFQGVTGSQPVTVSPATVIEVTVTPAVWTGAVGEDQRFLAQAIFSDGTSQDVTGAATWTSSAPTVAQVSNRLGSRGLVEALAAGSAEIRATYQGVIGSADVTVTSATVDSVQVTPFLPTLAAGTPLQFQAVAIFSDGTSRNVTREATWTSSDTAVAQVSNAAGPSRGVATAVAAGTTTVRAQYLGVSGSTTLTVTAATIDRIQVTPLAPRLPAGFGVGLRATAIFTDGSTRDVTGLATWTSSAPAVASVSNAFGSRGQVLSLTAGSATVDARYLGVTGSTTVTVTTATLSSIAVSPGSATIGVGDRTAFTATGTFSDASTLDLTTFVTWSSTDLAVADVSNGLGTQGEAVGFAAGTVTVRARSGAVTGTATLTVN
ncbi:MAG: Ig-like domain-containing protein [Sandaracinaceae bacterium]